MAAMFGAGVLTSLTPCVYPMIPITSAVIAGTARENQPKSRTVAGKDITLAHDGTVTAGKKLKINGEADVLLDQDHDMAIAIYDATATVWNVMAPGAGGGGANHESLDGYVHPDSVPDGLTRGTVSCR